MLLKKKNEPHIYGGKWKSKQTEANKEYVEQQQMASCNTINHF